MIGRWFDRLLLCAATLVVSVNLLPLAARSWWVLDLTTHFRVQYVAATALVFVVAALRRRRVTCLVLLATGAVSFTPLIPYLPLATPAPPAGSAALKVMTVNISFGRFSPRRLLEIVREADPDLLVMQELTPYAEGALKVLDEQFAHHYKLPADGAYGIGLWSRFELERAVPFALARLPAVEARVRGPSGTFTVLGVHLSAPTTPRRGASRNRELVELAARSAAVTGPLIVAGDFNITPYSPFFTDWLAASRLTDSRRGRTLSPSWPTTLPALAIPIDHVAVNDGFSIAGHRRLPNFESDHYGVLVELVARASAPSTEQP